MEDDNKSRRYILNLLITRRGGSHKRPVAKFLVPDWGDIVNPRPESTNYSRGDYEFGLWSRSSTRVFLVV